MQTEKLRTQGHRSLCTQLPVREHAQRDDKHCDIVLLALLDQPHSLVGSGALRLKPEYGHCHVDHYRGRVCFLSVVASVNEAERYSILFGQQ